jgi:hypothetical protein
VEFQTKGDKAPRAIRVTAWRPNAVLDWRVIKYEEEPAVGTAEKQAGRQL